MNALIGHTGFVGGNLTSCRTYDAVFNSTSIDSIRGSSFEHIVCAGVQAMKWWANLNPAEDKAGIQRLLDPLTEIKADRFTLISTIDVYPTPRDVNEDLAIERNGHHSYGLHRLDLEDRIRSMFPRVMILRLPGLFGPGIKKNVIYDLIHDNDLNKIHASGCFQYYDLRRLADDIDKAWKLDIELLNISSCPVLTSEIRDCFFPGKELGATGPAPASYDMRSKHTDAWSGTNGYLYSKEQVMHDLGGWLKVR